MKRLFFAIFIFSVTAFFNACSNIDAGEEGVVTKKPWIFGHGGIEKEPITTGMTWTAPSTSVDRYDIKPIQYDEVFDDLITADNNPVDFNTYLELQIEKGKSPKLHENFGKEWYARKVKEPYRTFIRNLARRQTMFALTTDPSTLDEMGTTAKAMTEELLRTNGLPVKVNRVTIGKASPPKDVIEETMRTAGQKQREITEQARATAELSRKKAEENKALADNAYREKFGMSVDQYLQLRALEIEKEKLDIVRNKENVTIILNSGGAVPMFNAGGKK